MTLSALKQQAAALKQQASQNAGTQQFLLFDLNSAIYAVAIEAVREIIGVSYLTRVPLTPPFLRGVMNLRGAVVPVVDLAVRFGDAATPLKSRTCVVIVEVATEQGPRPTGVIVDSVREVYNAAAEDIEARPAFGSGLRADFIVGMLRREPEFVPVLDVNSVLAQEELAQLVEARYAALPPVRAINSED